MIPVLETPTFEIEIYSKNLKNLTYHGKKLYD